MVKRGLVKVLLLYTSVCQMVRTAAADASDLLQQVVGEEVIVAEIEKLTQGDDWS